MVMSMKNEKIDNIVGDYKYGFRTEAKEIYSTGRGLNLEVVLNISKFKGEPEWMKEIRVKAYQKFVDRKSVV